MDAVKDQELLKEIRDRWDEADKSWGEAYDEALDDLKFVRGEQWPASLKADREADGRPCLTINKISVFGDQLIGDIRMNEPSIKVKPVDSGSDPDVAEILSGLIRNIEVQSNAEIAYDTAAESAVWCGFGAFRVITEYTDEDSFDQDIRIKRIKNPFQVFWDPAAVEWDKSDARYVFIAEMVPREEFDKRYPDASPVSAPGKKDSNPKWADDKGIRVVEYFRKIPETKKLYLLRDEITGDEFVSNETMAGAEVVRKRDIESTKIEWFKTNGHEILEGPSEWPGVHIPVCGVFGKELCIEGESIYRGIVRNSKDPARLYNYSRSHHAELTSLAPKVPYLVTGKMIGNYQSIWDSAHKKTYPYLPFDPDPNLPAFPQRSAPVAQNTGILAEIQIADQEMHDTTGLQQSSLGKTSNEKSGKAILARQREGDVANYAYYDNLARAVTYCGKVLLDLIPRIYDTERIVRIMGEDGSEQFVPVNQPVKMKQPDGQVIERIFDLTIGKYDVVVSVGPSYSTQREESVDSMMAFLQAVPNAGQLIGDLITRNMDWPGADEISDRLKAMLPPQVANPGQPAPQPPPDPKEELDRRKKAADIEGKVINNKMDSIELSRMLHGVDK